jgi:hypothetical protein
MLDPSIVKIRLTTFCMRKVWTTRVVLTELYIFGQHITALAGKGNTETLAINFNLENYDAIYSQCDEKRCATKPSACTT